MSAHIVFITGGARSGKSSFALMKAGRIKGRRAFIATAQALDEEMRQRIERHKRQRGAGWDTYEEPLRITDTLKAIKDKYSVIVIDCLTLWLSNVLDRTQNTEHRIQMIENDIQEFIGELKTFKDASRITYHASRLFIVSNEVGMGIVPDNEMARQFRDLAGYLNQKVAEMAGEVYLIVSGIPVRIK